MKAHPKFSFFRAPVTRNKAPHANITLRQIYDVLTGDYHQKITEELRNITNKEENRRFKARWFNYVTFSGTFKKRGEKYLETRTGYLVLDFDNLPDVNQVKTQLLKDEYFETQLLFVSPNGKGLKWLIEIDLSLNYTHGEWFAAVYNYINSTYSIEVDKSGSDLSRVCFIGHDVEAHIHPKYLVQ